MRLLLPALTLMAAPVLAEPAAGANPVIPVGVVACVTVKDLKDYNTYVSSAPAFAKDLLDRATCYVSESPTPAVVVNGQTTDGVNYTRYKLLSGHKVWVANPAKRG